MDDSFQDSLEELYDEYLSKEDLFMNKDAEKTAQEKAAQRKGRHS